MTQKQMTFTNQYVATGCASEAYRRAYPRSRAWKPETVHKRASELLRHGEVMGRVEQLQGQAATAAKISHGEMVEGLARAFRCRVVEFLRPDGSADVARLLSAGAELDELTVEDTPHGRRIRVKKAPLVAVADRLCKVMGWDKPQKIEVDADRAADRAHEVAVLKEVFRAMSPEEREAWIEEHALCEPSQKSTATHSEHPATPSSGRGVPVVTQPGGQ